MRFLVAAYCLALACFVVIIVAGSVVLLSGDDADGAEAVAGEHGVNVVTWELRHFPEKWLYKVGDFIVGHDDGDDDEAIARYFGLVEEIRRLEEEAAAGSDNAVVLAAKEKERADLENRVEDIIEGRVTAVLEDEELTMAPPPFTEMDMVFPPVDFEFDSPPRVLATSPRDRIALEHDYLLGGVTRDEVEEIEAEAEDGETSAIVVQSGGVATYPSIIANNRSYEGIVDTVFHEWLHQNLVFYPLGSRYFQGSQLRTLNESVANIGGEELGGLYFERWPLSAPEPEAAPETEPEPEPEEEPFDFTAAMRALRVEVEALLAEGKVEEAEALMDAKRDEFEEKGVFVRRINQAYFAFGGFYADTAASIDPIGPKLAEVFEESGSPGEFVRRVRGIESVKDLDVLVEGGGD